MSVRPVAVPTPAPLHGPDGDLISIAIGVIPYDLERLLDALARLAFPVNPEIHHRAEAAGGGPGGSRPAAVVEFPAWSNQLDEVERALEAYRLKPLGLEVRDAFSLNGEAGRVRKRVADRLQILGKAAPA